MADEAREAWKAQVGERLRKASRDADISQAEMARQLRLSKQLMSHWFAGSSEATAWDLLRVGKLLNADPGWLLAGEQRRLSQSRGADQEIIKANTVQLLDFARTMHSFDPEERKTWSFGGSRERVRVLSRGLSGRSVAFDCFDRAMAPEIEPGDLCVTDGAIEPADGDIALYGLPEAGQLLLRRVLRPPTGRTIVLKANQRKFFDEVQVSNAHVHIGTLVETTRFRRPRASVLTTAKVDR